MTEAFAINTEPQACAPLSYAAIPRSAVDMNLSPCDETASPEPATLCFEFTSHVVTFADNTRWQLLEPLSNIKLQQEHAPCEGTQVFTCICLDEPWCNYGEAVMKIKFQVRAEARAIGDYEQYIHDLEEDLKHFPGSAESARASIDNTRSLLHSCTHPTDRINQDTVDEAAALDHLGALECKHAPALLDVSISTVQSGTHEEAIPDGYLAFLLMTQLPGKRIMYRDFWSRPLEERDEIRAAFKEALLAVRNCRIGPHDCAMRNILWDDEQRKCYIVDFEDCVIADEDAQPPEWDEREFEAWNIARELLSGIVT